MLFAKDALWGVFILFCFISILEVCDFMTWHLVVVLRVLEWHQETVGLVWFGWFLSRERCLKHLKYFVFV